MKIITQFCLELKYTGLFYLFNYQVDDWSGEAIHVSFTLVIIRSFNELVYLNDWMVQ